MYIYVVIMQYEYETISVIMHYEYDTISERWFSLCSSYIC